jgi:hypothetical protein
MAKVANIRRTLGKAIDSWSPMPFTFDVASLAIAVNMDLASLVLGVEGHSQSGQGSGPDGVAAKGVHCPADFEAVFDSASKVLRCQRDVVAWVVTGCPEKDFATYSAKPGPDSCGRTEIPGVGTPPGATASRPVACAARGYAVVVDRTGPRDRCERTERSFALPRPVP